MAEGVGGDLNPATLLLLSGSHESKSGTKWSESHLLGSVLILDKLSHTQHALGRGKEAFTAVCSGGNIHIQLRWGRIKSGL